MGEVLRVWRRFENGLALALVSTVTPHAGLVAVQNIVDHTAIMHIKRSDPGVFLRAQRQGADILVEKPFTKWLLFERLEALLATAAGRRLKIVELPNRRFQLGTARREGF